MRWTWPTPPHSTHTIGVGAGGRARSPRTSSHGTGGAQVDRVAHAEHGLLEGEVHDDLEVCAAGRTARAPAAAAERAAAAEEGVEDVADAPPPPNGSPAPAPDAASAPYRS